jgi:diguanylate cyclase (GGDEF)-like protein
MARRTPLKRYRTWYGIMLLVILWNVVLSLLIKSPTGVSASTSGPSDSIFSEIPEEALHSLEIMRVEFPPVTGRGVGLPVAAQLGILVCGAGLFGILWRRLLREKQLSRTDPLTGVANQRGFLEAVRRGFISLRNTKCVLTIAYIDLDDFKVINDRWGHRAGDAVLQLVASTIRKNLRHTDCVARLGGDEFVVLFYDTGLAAAQSALGHVFEHLSRTLHVRLRSTTCSIGAMVYETCPPSIEFAMRRADELMYLVKRGGKNRMLFKIWEQKPHEIEFLRSEEFQNNRVAGGPI